jgi:site-specific DNA-methyltransferase (adenine-specific)/adenine-specific DNA-methyltransferase
MPTLSWIGKKAVENHHRQVPFHLLKDVPELSVGEPGAGNLLVEGDNLVALKALLPYYAGSVKCIYIDPPYNTGNENWIYNDNVNSPEMRDWLGKVVGGELEDLTRHDKWLCMMYPRLGLLWQLLREDGAIFISIDDNEVQNLRAIMDEIFGSSNFVSTIVWQKIYTVKNSAKHLSDMHDYVIIYARNKKKWKRNLRPRDEGTDEDYSNPDDDPEGPWISHALQSRNSYSKGIYPVKCPGGRLIEGPPPGTYWRIAEKKLWVFDKEGRVWWGEDGNNSPRIKEYLKNVKAGVVPTTWWTYQYGGTNSDAKVHLRQMIGDKQMFITPKPVSLIRRILELASDKDSIILDSFAGSGVTGHAVLEQNGIDGGMRRFILVEMEHSVASEIAARRLQRAIEGYSYTTNKGKKVTVSGVGGAFRYATPSDSLFDERGNIRGSVTFADLARHVYFTETGEPLATRTKSTSPLIGKCNGVAVYLLYNGILNDKTHNGGNVLTLNVLAHLPKHEGPKVVYGTACRLGMDRLRREGIAFKQLPYKLKVHAL